MYTCICDGVTLLYSRKLTERCKPAMIKKIKIFNKKNKDNLHVRQGQLFGTFTNYKGKKDTGTLRQQESPIMGARRAMERKERS